MRNNSIYLQFINITLIFSFILIGIANPLLTKNETALDNPDIYIINLSFANYKK